MHLIFCFASILWYIINVIMLLLLYIQKTKFGQTWSVCETAVLTWSQFSGGCSSCSLKKSPWCFMLSMEYFSCSSGQDRYTVITVFCFSTHSLRHLVVKWKQELCKWPYCDTMHGLLLWHYLVLGLLLISLAAISQSLFDSFDYSGDDLTDWLSALSFRRASHDGLFAWHLNCVNQKAAPWRSPKPSAWRGGTSSFLRHE
jgi:hypothetical protein